MKHFILILTLILGTCFASANSIKGEAQTTGDKGSTTKEVVTLDSDTDNYLQRRQLPRDMQQVLLDIEKNEIDRRVEYLQHEQNKFLTITGIVLAVLGLAATLILFVVGYFMSKNLGEKFDSKEQDMENRMQLLEKDTALRLEKLNMEVDYSEKSLAIIQLKIDEAVRQAMEKVENKTDDETERFKEQIQKIAAEAKSVLVDINHKVSDSKGNVEEEA